MPEQTRPVFIDGLYGKLVEGGINYFFPSATLQVIEAGVEPVACCMTDSSDQTSLILSWLGSRYLLTRNEAPGGFAGCAGRPRNGSKPCLENGFTHLTSKSWPTRGRRRKRPVSLLVASEAHHGPPERRAGDCGEDRWRNRSGFPIEPARIRGHPTALGLDRRVSREHRGWSYHGRNLGLAFWKCAQNQRR